MKQNWFRSILFFRNNIITLLDQTEEIYYFLQKKKRRKNNNNNRVTIFIMKYDCDKKNSPTGYSNGNGQYAATTRL